MVYLQRSKFTLPVDSEFLSLSHCIKEDIADQDSNGKYTESENFLSPEEIKARKIYSKLVLSPSKGCCKTMCLSVKGTGISCVGYTYHSKGNQCTLKITHIAEKGAQGDETSLPQTGIED